ncbi:uncharacterized protein [Rutidosis leptorrhynchoides]|uniref:uncharacterized protein n=1 Tax=Rutidosis leptorrhynchoides TaxID=125765 RepID=UPI003A99A5CF
MVENYCDWHDQLPYVFLAYQTSICTSIEATPFSLVYEMEAILPVEIEIPSLRVLSQIKLSEAEWVQQRFEQLNTIDEKRAKALYPRGKFTPNYEGLYIVRKVLPGGALILVEMDDQELPRPVNVDAIKKYYP